MKKQPQIPFVPEDAPFSTGQRAWLNGFLAGLHSSRDLPGAQTTVGKSVTILFGSQTGNSEGLAKKVNKALKQWGADTTLMDMGDYDTSKLSDEKNLIIITSTYGDGEPPDNAQAFHEFVHADTAPKLDKLEYSILGLGDSGYPDFCQCSREIDKRIHELGAKRAAPVIESDVDFDEPFEEWMKGVREWIRAAGETEDVPATPEDEVLEHGKNNPFPAKLLTNRLLNKEGSGKEVRHFEISLEGSGLNYEAGDALAVVPQNCPELVSAIIQKAELNPIEMVPLPGGGESNLKEALTMAYDIRLVNAAVLKKLLPFVANPEWEPLLEQEKKKELENLLWGKELIDFLNAGLFKNGKEFVGQLRKLQPRLYSISSSPNAHPGEVHLTVGAVRYDSDGTARKGVCSTYLADRAGEGPVGVFVHHNKAFRLPEDGNKPVIMVGPGTGIAPFRAFLEERKASGALGKNWLFFGDRTAETDFLYQEELEGYVSDGSLSRLDTAFSRDQAEKIYVQTRMIQNAQEIWNWFEEGASFYVCGDASRMAKDVDAALHKIAKTEGRMSDEGAAAYITKLKKEKRYLRDVY